MTPKTIMVIAGELSGDQLAAELVTALRRAIVQRQATPSPDLQPLRTGLEPRFFGAGGPAMQAAGVELAMDVTRHAVIGLSDALRRYPFFLRLFRELLRLARARQPDAIVLVDFSGFNLRFARTLRRWVGKKSDGFHTWRPKIIYYVAPQVWASRAGRAYAMARDLDLVLSILPFEKAWYAARVPDLRVEFVGHPMVDRYPAAHRRDPSPKSPRRVLLLPGSRRREIELHLPLMAEAARLIAARQAAEFVAVLPNAALVEYARSLVPSTAAITVQTGNLASFLSHADAAIASTGTVTLECAFFSLPTVAIYRTSWITYQLGRRLIQVPFLALPNLLAGAVVYPELIQHQATPQNIADAALELLNDHARRSALEAKLEQIVQSLGPPGAPARAAQLIAELIG